MTRWFEGGKPNTAGHRLYTGELEQAVAAHPAVAECAMVGVADEDKGQVPVGIGLLKDGVNMDAQRLQSELVQMVRAQVGAFANFKRHWWCRACRRRDPMDGRELDLPRHTQPDDDQRLLHHQLGLRLPEQLPRASAPDCGLRRGTTAALL